jgi:hypothetical protein
MNSGLKFYFIGIFLAAEAAYGCGCIDSASAQTSAQEMKLNYKMADVQLFNELSSLGETIKKGYKYMSDGAKEAERVARVKKEQAVDYKKILFNQNKLSNLSSQENQLGGSSVQNELKNYELRNTECSIILNKENQYGE